MEQLIELVIKTFEWEIDTLLRVSSLLLKDTIFFWDKKIWALGLPPNFNFYKINLVCTYTSHFISLLSNIFWHYFGVTILSTNFWRPKGSHYVISENNNFKKPTPSFPKNLFLLHALSLKFRLKKVKIIKRM